MNIPIDVKKELVKVQNSLFELEDECWKQSNENKECIDKDYFIGKASAYQSANILIADLIAKLNK
jgi:hypothetical protein